MSVSTFSDPVQESPAPARFNPARWLWAAKPWRAAGFLLTSFVAGVTWFVVLTTLIATGVGLAITLIGLPILVLAMLTWIFAAKTERKRIGFFFGERIESPYQPNPPGPLFGRLRVLLGDRAVWKDLVYHFFLFWAGILELVVAVVAISVPPAMLLYPFYYRFTEPEVGLFEALMVGAGGILALGTGAFLMIVVARGHVMFARWLLGPSREEALEERVDVLTQTRSGVMEAALVERRRIERDLHDGAQQQLVSLAMNLGMAKEKMATDPAAAAALVDTAHGEAKLALAELRELIRGIHPAVLTDRGLDAAISAIAGRSPIPVTVDVDLARRPPEAVESTAYFIVTEALTNVAKHSGATKARVTIVWENDLLSILIWDNGNGGATLDDANGLGGLADRVAALDGRFTVESPAGGGTRVLAEIPCAS